jgi:hypothetical protein
MALMENPVSRIRIINSASNSCQFFSVFFVLTDSSMFLTHSFHHLGLFMTVGGFFWLLNGFKSRQEIGALMAGLAP